VRVLSSTEQIFLWIGCGGMGLGALAIAVSSRRAQPGERYHFIISAAVCAIAFVAYFAMANGYGIVHLPRTAGWWSYPPLSSIQYDPTHGARDVFIARYIDWTITTPLLIAGLLLIGLPAAQDDPRPAPDRYGLIFGTLGADVFMILVGLCAGLTENKPVKYGFYAISSIAFLIVLWVLWRPVRTSGDPVNRALSPVYATNRSPDRPVVHLPSRLAAW
jgi:bacteriorhodopsin